MPPILDDATAGLPPVFEPETLAELKDAFGRSRLMNLLNSLRDEIGDRLSAADQSPAALARDAHALVSVSGTLGFLRLSHACSDLEQACRAGEAGEALSRAQAAGREALAAIDELQGG